MSRLTQDTNYYYYSYQYRDFTFSVLPFQVIPVQIILNSVGPTTPTLPKQYRFGLFPFRSPLLGKSLNCFLFLRVLRCFSSPRSHIIADIIPLHGIGLPHSEISGSKCMCHSPKLIAGYHVLHRLLPPRHPPYALIRLTI